MKDDRDLVKLIFGIFMVLIGGMLFISTFFNISIPIFKTAVSFILIYFGITILLGKKSLFFVTEKVDQNRKDYLVLFSSSNIDASEVEGKKILNVDVVLGQGVIYIKKGMNCKIYATSVFGQLTTPHGDNIVFGNKDMKMGENPEEGLIIIATVVLGTLEIVEK
ncbi:MAG: hypothetical protein ABIN39_06175 [candidate division WOR-3 bacterium]